MTFHIITIFPNIFKSYFSESIIGRAQKNKLINIKIYNLRDWTTDRHKSVDDAPFGGGAGMLLKIEPLYKALAAIKKDLPKTSSLKTILLSPRGEGWKQKKAKYYSNNYSDLILICGRYEGVDERIEFFIDETVSIGDYVLTGGEIAAMALTDSITRLLSGVLGNDKSSTEESHTRPGMLEYPQYTRPKTFVDTEGKEYVVPAVLLSGNHKKIAIWHKKHKSIK